MGSLVSELVAFVPACGKSITLSGSAADALAWHVPVDLYLVGVKGKVTTAVVASTTAPVVSVDYADADGSTNRTEFTTITFANGDAVGHIAASRKKGVLVAEGKTIILEHKTQAVGSAAGVATCWILLAPAGRADYRSQ